MYIFSTDKYHVARFEIPDSGNNYNYIIHCSSTGECAVIDPLDSGILLNYIRNNDLKVKYIINTHTHPDHIKDNNPILKVTTGRILVHRDGLERVAPRAEAVGEGDRIDIGKFTLDVIHTPGHCPEHISLKTGNDIFVGDTLFLAGCGNTRFRGNPEELYETIAFKLMPLADETRFFCGHDYAEKNLGFALDIEPGNTDAQKKLSEVKSLRSRDSGEIISTIGEEKLYNPFMRFEKDSVIEGILRQDKNTPVDPKSVFVKIRELRDSW